MSIAEYQRLQACVQEVNRELDSGKLGEIVRKLSVLRGDNNLEYAKNYIASLAGDDVNPLLFEFVRAGDQAKAATYDVEENGFGDSMHIVHSMDITDAMRKSVLYEGQPRFSVAKPDDTTGQTDTAADDELFTFDNAVRFAVGGGRTIDYFVAEILRRREVSHVRSNTFRRSGIFTQAGLALDGLHEKDMSRSSPPH